jgi:integrase
MKGRQAHLVPLSRQALALLRELHAITGGQGYLFPSERRPVACMGSSTINGALVRMGYHGKDSDIGTSAHGFRATFSTFLNELGYRADLIEKQLAHAERNSVPASYNQAAYLEERRAMMQRWADFIDAIQAGDNVVPIKSKAA